MTYLVPDAAEHVEREEQGVFKLELQDPAPLRQEDWGADRAAWQDDVLCRRSLLCRSCRITPRGCLQTIADTSLPMHWSLRISFLTGAVIAVDNSTYVGSGYRNFCERSVHGKIVYLRGGLTVAAAALQHGRMLRQSGKVVWLGRAAESGGSERRGPAVGGQVHRHCPAVEACRCSCAGDVQPAGRQAPCLLDGARPWGLHLLLPAEALQELWPACKVGCWEGMELQVRCTPLRERRLCHSLHCTQWRLPQGSKVSHWGNADSRLRSGMLKGWPISWRNAAAQSYLLKVGGQLGGDGKALGQVDPQALGAELLPGGCYRRDVARQPGRLQVGWSRHRAGRRRAEVAALVARVLLPAMDREALLPLCIGQRKAVDGLCAVLAAQAAEVLGK